MVRSLNKAKQLLLKTVPMFVIAAYGYGILKELNRKMV